MKARITQSQALRGTLLRELHRSRLENPAQPWRWRRDLEQAAGGPVDFELDYLVERGDIVQDGLKFRITAQGIDVCERACLGSNG